MKRMNCEQARQISIVDYLAKCGIAPIYIRGINHWYLSPLRDEHTASFKVNNHLNSWYDHGIGKGGNLVDLGILLHKCRVEDLLQRLSREDYSLSFHQQKKQIAALPESRLIITAIKTLDDISLISYLHSREIDYYMAKAYCKEVSFLLNGQSNLAIGFANNVGGYELRNAHLKVSSSPKDISFFDRGSDTIHVLEGFIDFLSLLTINPRDFAGDFLVLNSLSFVAKALPEMREYEQILLYLDQDKAGIKATADILEALPKATDASLFYENHQDINDYLTNEYDKGKGRGRSL
jgi:hypothetical protein